MHLKRLKTSIFLEFEGEKLMFGLQKCQERVFLKAQRVKKPFNLPECRRNDLLPSWPQEAMQPWHAGDVFRSKQKRCHGRTLANSQVPVKGA